MNLKTLSKVTVVAGLSLQLLLPGIAPAAEVVAHSPDKTVGRLLGGSTAFLLGGFLTGGPLGAIGAGLAGAWLGGEVEEAAGMGGQLHHVRTDDGEVRVLRSPGRTFAVGQEVVIRDGRPRDVGDSNANH